MKLMKKHKSLILILVTALVLTLAILGFQRRADDTDSPAENSEVQTAPEEIAVSLEIESVLSQINFEVEDGASVLEMLQTAGEEENFVLETKDYAGLGTLVETIGGIENGTDGKYWHYEVNDELPLVGAGDYELSEGDAVLWKFSEPEF